MNFITRTLVAAAIIAGGALPLTAQASGEQPSGCVDGGRADNYTTSYTRGGGTIVVKNGQPLCHNQTVTLEIFTLPESWDRKGFNQSALPQTKFAAVTFTIPAGQANFQKTMQVNVPDACKSTQIDFYKGNGFEKLTGLHEDDAAWIGGQIFTGTGACATPTPKPTATPVPKPSATPSPAPTKPSVPVATPTPAVLGTSTQLPDTGAEGLMAALGMTAMGATAGIYLKQRFARRK